MNSIARFAVMDTMNIMNKMDSMCDMKPLFVYKVHAVQLVHETLFNRFFTKNHPQNLYSSSCAKN